MDEPLKNNYKVEYKESVHAKYNDRDKASFEPYSMCTPFALSICPLHPRSSVQPFSFLCPVHPMYSFFPF